MYGILRRVFEQLVNSRAVTMLRYTRCNMVILMAATAWLMLSFSSASCADLIRIPYFSLGTLGTYGIRIKSAHDTNRRTTSAKQLQPSKALRYMGYTSTWLDVRSCVMMQEATTFNIYYGISFQDLAIVIISVFTLCYGLGLLFRGPFCICKSSPSM